MPTLNITVLDKIATGDGQEIVCDNTDYLVHFDLDSEWDSYSAKTMRVLYLDGTYDDVIFTGDTATLPRIYEPNIYSYFTIGIGIYAGNLHSTVAAIFKCKESVFTGGSQHPDPPEDIYNQILDDINSGMLRGKTGNGIASVALTSTVGNVDTYTITFTDGNTTTYDVTNGAVTSVDGLTGAVELDYKANIDGYYDGLASGTANQLLSDKTVTDNAPCVFRPSGGGNHIGDRKEIKEVVGASVVWNQLVRNGDFSDGTTRWYSRQSGGLSIANGEAILELKVANANNGLYQLVSGSIKAGHKYLIRAKLYTHANSSIQRVRMGLSTSYVFDAYQNVNITTSKTEYAAVLSLEASSDRLLFLPIGDSYTIGDKLYVDDVTLVDLTPTSSAIADRAYTLEQSTAGSGVAWLKSYGFFTKSYYAYTASPSIQSVKVSAHETVGLQQWDEEWQAGSINSTTGGNQASQTTIRSKNYCRILPNTTYCMYCEKIGGYIFFYDDNKNYISYKYVNKNNPTFITPSNAYYFKIRMSDPQYGGTYTNDICVNIHGDRDGEYEPYQKNTYAFDSTKTLNGILKLDSNNNIYAYGDTYPSDRTIVRNFAEIDLGSLTWTLINDDNDYFRASAPTGTNRPVAATLNAICPRYSVYIGAQVSSGDLRIGINGNAQYIYVRDDSYTDAATFKTAMSGVKLIYEVETPTTETADAYQQVMAVDPEGTERWVDAAYEAGDRDFEMPVGHITEYHADLKAKLEAMPDGPSSDGDYLLRRRNGVNTYVRFVSELPAEPTEDGVYTLTATVSGGVATYSWEA